MWGENMKGFLCTYSENMFGFGAHLIRVHEGESDAQVIDVEGGSCWCSSRSCVR